MDHFFVFLVILLSRTISTHAEPYKDREALLDFLNNIHHSHNIDWSQDSSACNWTGVICNNDQSRVVAVRLPGVGFHGPIPANTLSRLSAVQTLSLRSNSLSGPFPSDFSKLGNLTSLYLQSNQFSGQLPTDFSAWKNLAIINLSNNDFNGSIPSSFSNLTHLTALNLANNSFSGDIPDLRLPSLQQIDLSNNNLTGKLPESLSRFPSSAFSSNNISSSNYPPSLPPFPANSQPSTKSHKIGEPAILGIILGGCVLGFVICAVSIVLCFSNRGVENEGKPQKGNGSLTKSVHEKRDVDDRLVFFESSNLAFDLEDLLRASAEVLGKGTFGVTYKAALEDSTTMVVKRLKEMALAKRDFEQQMEVVGSIRHENVAALRAYFYSKDEKLMVYDYFSAGSVSPMLHGNRGNNQRTPLDWETRLKIAVGTARGIAHIHTQNGGKLVHGNIKSSNVFINSSHYGCVSDLGLATLMSPMGPPMMRASGYRAPEVTHTKKASQPSDVYSYGVFLFELLTGKSPVHNVGGGEVVHLVRWVQSVVREEWTAEVFDFELLRYPNIEEEMVEMLQIGMACVARMPEQRPKMRDVVKMVEEIRRVSPRTPQLVEGSTSAPPPQEG